MAYQPVQRWERKITGERRGVGIFRDTVLFWTHSVGQPTHDMGIVSRRFIAGTLTLSLHYVGRAWDCGVPDARVDARLGQALADKAVAEAAMLGVCEVIFNRRRWTQEKGWRKYWGVNPHYDHVHFGFTIGMADNQSDRQQLIKWFSHYMFDINM